MHRENLPKKGEEIELDITTSGFGGKAVGRNEGLVFFVKDAVMSYLLVAENLHRKDVVGRAFNFGSAQNLKIIDLVNLIIEISGKTKLKPIILDNVKKEITDQYLSSRLAQSVLDWKPEYTIKEGLKETFKWYEEYFGKTY